MRERERERERDTKRPRKLTSGRTQRLAIGVGGSSDCEATATSAKDGESGEATAEEGEWV